MRLSRKLPGVAALLCVSAAASAQNYPNRPLRMIIGFAPGGSTPREWGDFVKAEISKWAKVVKEAGVKVE